MLKQKELCAVFLALYLLCPVSTLHAASLSSDQKSELIGIGHSYALSQKGNTESSQTNRAKRKPPQEAIDACNGKKSGETVSFTTPRGDSIKGKCVKMGNMLFAIPEDGPPPHNRQQSSDKV